MKTKKLFLILSGMLLVLLSFAVSPVNASARTIMGNGTDGISINIDGEPFKTLAEKNPQTDPYGEGGCGWYASSRASQVMGKQYTVYNGTGWYYTGYSKYGFERRTTPVAYSLACFPQQSNGWAHVMFIERVSSDGNTLTVSHGGYNGIDSKGTKSGPSNGYCIIQKLTVSQMVSTYGKPLGYVVLGKSPSSGSGSSGSSPFKQILSDDRYYIESAVGNSQYMTVAGHSGKKEANIQTWNSTMLEDVFIVEHVGSGYFKIKNYISGYCVDIRGSAPFESKDNIHQYTDNGHDEQKWGLVQAGNGYYYIRSKANTNLSIDVASGVNKNGTNIRAHNKNEAAAQKWKFITDGRKIGKTIEPGYYYIKSGVGNGQYLNVNGTNVEISNAKSVNQIFYVDYLGTGRYTIRHCETNKMVEIPGIENVYMGKNVMVSVPDSGRDQQWIIKPSGSAFEIVNRINGFRMDVNNARNTNGTNVGLHRKNGNKAQKYTFEKAVLPSGISLNRTKLVLKRGTTGTLTATVSPSNAADRRVTWVTSDSSIATVKDGKINALKTGTVTISAVTMNDRAASCKVTVTNAMLVRQPVNKPVAQIASTITQTSDKKESSYSTFNLLQARAKKVKKRSITLKWTKIYGATGYIIYGNRCGASHKYKKIAEIGSGSRTSKTITAIRGKKLKKASYYKFIVAAVKGGKTLAVSKSIHIMTAGSKKYGDWTGVKLKNITGGRLTLKKGRTFTIRASAVKPKKKKVQTHRKLCYESDRPSVAKVTKKGVITAKKKGRATIYVYAQNGLFEKFTVTVK